MARKYIDFYSDSEKAIQIRRYEVLQEKSKRHFLAFEYLRLGVGSQSYLARTFQSSKDRIRKGVIEVSATDFAPDYRKQRSEGGGRKKKK